MSKPAKARFVRLNADLSDGPGMDVAFNPTEFTLSKSAHYADVVIPGLDSPILQFVSNQTETLALDLFFDTTDGGMAGGAKPVTELTDQFYQLIKIDREAHSPPVCRFTWGKDAFPGSKFNGKWDSQRRVNGFQCVVDSVRQRFSLFSTEGVPLRAVLTVTLKEYRTLEQQIKEIFKRSADHTKAYVIREGETLGQIASGAYGDPKWWRVIADANNLDDPLLIQPGVTLAIPPLPVGARKPA